MGLVRKHRGRRFGLILLAIAFLLSGVMGSSAPAAAMISPPLGHHHHQAGAANDHALAHATPTQAPVPSKALDCRHGGDCLQCAAVLLPLMPGPIGLLRPQAVTFRAMVMRLSGVSTRPELFPPIRQA